MDGYCPMSIDPTSINKGLSTYSKLHGVIVLQWSYNNSYCISTKYVFPFLVNRTFDEKVKSVISKPYLFLSLQWWNFIDASIFQPLSFVWKELILRQYHKIYCKQGLHHFIISMTQHMWSEAYYRVTKTN